MTDAVTYAMKVWPKGFTKVELAKALQRHGAISELRKLRAIEDTGMRRQYGRRKLVVWRYKPYQLPLPLGGER